MSLWNREPDGTGDLKGVRDIQAAEVTKSITMDGKTLKIRIQGAYTGIVDGRRELLDEPLVDNMVDRIASALKGNTSKYNPMPDEIIIRRGGSREDAGGEKQGLQEQDAVPAETSQGMIEASEPEFSLEQVILNDKVRQQVNTAISAVRHKKKWSRNGGCPNDSPGAVRSYLIFTESREPERAWRRRQ